MILKLTKKHNYPIKYNKIKVFINNKFADFLDDKSKNIACNEGDIIHFEFNKFRSNEVLISKNLKEVEVSSSINNGLYITAYVCFFLSLILFLTKFIENYYVYFALLIPMGIVTYTRIINSKDYLNAAKVL